MAYHFGLAEPQKARMETAGRVELTADDSRRLMQTRMVYVPVIIVGIAVAVIRRTIWSQFFSGFVMLATAEAIRVLLFDEHRLKGLAMSLARLIGGLATVAFVQFIMPRLYSSATYE
jgi:hypothetical protein